MSRLLDPEDALRPCNDFVRRWVGWLVHVDDSRLDIVDNWPLERGATVAHNGEYTASAAEPVDMCMWCIVQLNIP